MFALDRDLLALEPTLFRDLQWAGQTLARGNLISSGLGLQFDFDVDLSGRGVGPGSVVVATGVSYEVVELLGAAEFAVTLPRDSLESGAMSPGLVGSGLAWIVTFRSQIAMAHRNLLAMAGIDADAAPAPDVVTADKIVNWRSLRYIEALAALKLIWTAAGVGLDEKHPANQRAAEYGARFREARHTAVLEIDTDGDGKADAVRRLGAVWLVRG
ncbi:MAG: hypothetical protein WC718_01110 [Phycisphaerales bacterium]|jgi:hypothetical protein